MQGSYYSVPQNSISCLVGRVAYDIDPTKPDSIKNAYTKLENKTSTAKYFDKLKNANFVKDSLIVVDIVNLTEPQPPNETIPYGLSGSTLYVAKASWTIRSAYTAWYAPPAINYSGRLVLKGGFNSSDTGKIKLKLSNVQLSQFTLQGGPPLQGTCTTPAGPGTCTIPFSISSASGQGTIDATASDQDLAYIEIADPNVSFELHTGDGEKGYDRKSDHNITLISEQYKVVPWCVPAGSTEENARNEKEDDEDDKNRTKAREAFIAKNDLVLCIAINNSLDNLYVIDIFR